MSASIHSHRFDNGLVLVAEPNRSLESAAFTILVPGGSVYDPAERSGLSTLVCEMSTRGCGNRDHRQFVQDLENLGVEHGESVSTSHISYSGATLARNLTPALAIYADLLRRPQMPERAFPAAQQVAIQEIRATQDEPQQKLMLELRRLHYGHPWGRPSQGELTDIEATSLAEVRDFQRQVFSPRDTIIGVAGRVDWERLRDEIGTLLGDWQPQPPRETAPEQEFCRREHLSLEANQTHLGIAYDSVPYAHADYFQAAGAVGVLSGGMSSRLFTEVREKRGLCYTVHASIHTLKTRGSVLCYAGTTAERAQETLDVTLNELLRIAQGIEQRELDRLKARIKSGLIMQQESSAARSGAIARDWYHLGRARTLAEVGQIVDALSCESINRFLLAHPPRDFTILTLGPQPLEIPSGIS